MQLRSDLAEAEQTHFCLHFSFALVEQIVRANEVQSDCQYANSPELISNLLIRLCLIGLDRLHDSTAAEKRCVWRLGWSWHWGEHRDQSEFGHGYVEVVPRAHPQFLLVWLRSVTGAPEGAPHNQPLVIIGGTAISLWPSLLPSLWRALPLLCGHLRRSERVQLCRRALGACATAAAAAGGRHVGLMRADSSQWFIPVGSGSWTLEGAEGVAASRCCGAVQRDPFLQRGGHFVEFFKVLDQPRAKDRGGDLEIVVSIGMCVWGPWGADRTPRADDGAILGHVDAAVDVRVAVEAGRDAAALSLRNAVLSRWAGLIFPIHQQLDPTFSGAELRKQIISH